MATAAWLTRNASADRALDSLLATRPWGHGWRDADEAAHGFFGTPAAALTAAGAALLAATLTDEANRSRGVDPWCAPAARLRASPLGVVARDCVGAALPESLGHRQEAVDVGGGVEEGR